MSRRIHSADELLREYAETKSLLYGASSSMQNLVAHSGGIVADECFNKKCSGRPKRLPDADGVLGWRCSACKKAWSIVQKDLGRNEFQDTRRGVMSIGELRIRLGDFAVILKHVQANAPWAFVAWYVHVLAPTREADESGPAEGLGVPLDLVPERMHKLKKEGSIDPPPGITLYRVRQWVDEAREETMRQIWITRV